MADNLNGRGVYWAIGAVTFTGTIIAPGSLQSKDLDVTSDEAECKNSLGQTISHMSYNGKRGLKLSILPDASTIANSVSEMWLPIPGVILVVATDPGSPTAATGKVTSISNGQASPSNGNYIVRSSNLKQTNTGFPMIDVTCVSWLANEVAVAAT